MSARGSVPAAPENSSDQVSSQVVGPLDRLSTQVLTASARRAVMKTIVAANTTAIVKPRPRLP
ncbi:hypothetical protein GCM10012289_18520 [Nonomuraea cavernae]|uniref:FXSXX-COOH protein n=1 Tax=Nonomuraea cavernae TaxID=2045107 RepID=A0A918DGW6_9ACTN|nr:hypothetical protein GCM10012289_18520 [Nonomuraea cavernae]